MRVHRIEGLAFCKRVSYAAVTPRYTAPRWLDGRGGGGLEKEEGCKCALLGRAVFQGIFAIKILRVRDSGGRVREAWKIRPIVCQFWIPAMVARSSRPSATVADLVITIIKLCFPITDVTSSLSPLSSFT